MDKLPGTEANHRGDTVMDVCRLLDTPLHGLFGTEANNYYPFAQHSTHTTTPLQIASTQFEELSAQKLSLVFGLFRASDRSDKSRSRF